MTDTVYGEEYCWYALAAAILGRDPTTRKPLTSDKALQLMGVKLNHAPPGSRPPRAPKAGPARKAYSKVSDETKDEVIKLRNQGLYVYEISAKVGISRTKAWEIVQWAERTGQAI